ncbi:HlyD family efflux transporter periplasmic adaptor subunit [Brevibacillus humidisoli]|uniref:HlyD family secretion protein n=1 Tax=Brevibacillus humidisoli TaxID=2895522 RepID=UPI001E423C51|nr:HlyD family efflux transporter periplasmic adaptor subunit [Brevibacillus humidisoli]UFJ39839.1 HlyD family efflux transporter periplasmic adaptor subunit [Brevibacillus humidisoli]
MRNRALLTTLSLSMFLLTSCSLYGQEDTTLSGTIEADELPIVAEVGGMVRSIAVDEGASLQQGEEIATIDDRTFRLQVEEAEALLAQATAKLEEAKAGTRNQTLQQAAASVQQSQATVQQAEARLRQAKAQVTRAQEQLQQVQAQLEGAKRTLAYHQSRLQETTQLFEQGAATNRDVETQQEAVNQAQTQVDQLTAQVSASRSQAISAENEVEAATAQLAAAQSQEDHASAQLDLLREGSTGYTIKALLAAEKQARAKLEAAKLQLQKTTLIAPADGILLRSNITEGEVVKAGATLFTMMKKEKLELTVYIPEADLGMVSVGQQVSVQVDAYPGEQFTGMISAIADKAEFTPKNVQTKEERTKLVFAVTIQLQNGFDKLKPGMPADVSLSEGEESR